MRAKAVVTLKVTVFTLFLALTKGGGPTNGPGPPSGPPTGRTWIMMSVFAGIEVF